VERPANPAWAGPRVFVLVLENRSFDHMLGVSTGAVQPDGELVNGTGRDPFGQPTTIDGPAGATGNTYQGRQYPTAIDAPFALPADPPHEFPDVRGQLGGTRGTADMSGFVASYARVHPADPGLVMRCFTAEQVPVLSTLAREFAVCDRWFSAMPGPTWPNRFFCHAGTSGGLDRSPNPTREFSALLLDGYRFANGTVYQRLDAAGIDWRVYHGDQFPHVLSLEGMRAKLAEGRFRGMGSFAADVARADFSPRYVFIEPSYGHLFFPHGDFTGGTSEHPDDDVRGGEGLIKQLYEAIRRSPHWADSVLLITYDEHGGFFDHVPSPAAVPPGDRPTDPDDNTYGFDFTRYGVRVPAVVVSPRIPRNTVDHRIYDHTSLLATLQRWWRLEPLTDRDRSAQSFDGLLSLSEPRQDAPVELPSPSGETVAPVQPAVVAAPPPGQPATLTQQEMAAAYSLDPRPIGAAINGFLQVGMLRDAWSAPESQRRRIAQHVAGLRSHGQAKAYLQKVAGKLDRDATARGTGDASH
jgi:phospholipase C